MRVGDVCVWPTQALATSALGADNARTIASAIGDLHANAKLYEKCCEAGLKYVEDELSEEKVDQAMRRASGYSCRARTSRPSLHFPAATRVTSRRTKRPPKASSQK